MSDATERPAADPDAWATACAEDLAAEKARRRSVHGTPPGSASEELLRFVDAVADKVSSLQSPLLGMAAQGAVQQFINQARSAVEPVIERNPGIFDHLAAAGNELLAAYRSAVEGDERRWTRGPDEAPDIRLKKPDGGTDGKPDGAAERKTDGGTERKTDGKPDGKTDGPSDGRDDGPASGTHIDLD
ncbi:DUF5304 domain-containing protein [Streptomyces sp. NBC_01498]|uniref:DUF5304 domain-containing protein n=1 Tax=Streptomyces sp. NBC_01498 TaxID=2975870 RepID=UPI002E7B7824|nr:DUF5304 domain-containing protein [Streptomyces sp. NBC_01498]WTL27292.1 DUF5304 domain-containing protein [Streptomyces sp. NBC_01498]